MNSVWKRFLDFLKSFQLLKASVWKVIMAFGMITSKNRDLPLFIIIGAQKAGTTSLFSQLSQHPELLPSLTKEVHFFDGGRYPEIEDYSKGETWYRANFPYQASSKKRKKTFEASPFYFFHPEVPKRIHSLMPQVKLIVLLRNPSERSVSHYFHESRKGREPLSIQEALDKEEERIEGPMARKDYRNHEFAKHTYKSRGRYKEQLERYYRYFSKEQILVLCSESFFEDPERNLRKVFRFLAIDENFKVPNLKPENVANNRSDVAPQTYEYLNRYFKSHNEDLFELLGERYNW